MASCKQCLSADVCVDRYIFGDRPACSYFKDSNRVTEEIEVCNRRADNEKVRHGKWIRITDRFFSSTDGKGGNVVKCSVCGEPSSCSLSTPYCSICGAKMDKE